ITNGRGSMEIVEYMNSDEGHGSDPSYGVEHKDSYDLTAGDVSNPQQILDSPIDGLGKDCNGNIYITTTTQVGERADGQVVLIIDKEYQKVGQLNVEGIHIVTNIAFGGENRKTLFVTGLTDPDDGDMPRYCGDSVCLSAGIYSAKLNVPGFPY
ncbi:MAG: SMP-30/gluconolactonase/LRE family protein, partial [Porticoccaceae bacterium]